LSFRGIDLNMNIKFCLLFVALLTFFWTSELEAEEFYYNFGDNLSGDQNLVNQLGSYEFTPSANDFRDHSSKPSYENGNVSLANGQFLATPPNVSTYFDFNKPVQFDLRFKFDNPITISSEKDFVREVLTTTTTDQRDEGFTLLVREESGEWLMQAQVGEGSAFQPPYNDVEGYVKTLAYIDPHSWQNLSIIFRLNSITPRVDFILNGSSQSMVLAEARRADVSKLITLLSGGDYYNKANGLDKLQIFAGGFPIVNTGCCDPRVHDSTLVLDFLHISAPKTLANAGEMSVLLKSMTDHINGKTILSAAELSQISQSFLVRFGGNWESISSEALEFLEAYSAKYPPIFDRQELYPSQFSPEKTLAFYLQKWIFDNLYVPETIELAAGITFEDANLFPGIVSVDAPRIVKLIEFDGDYATDPGSAFNGQETVFRPTGLYVAPGEIVTLDFEASAINQGLIARIGIHRFDLEAGNYTYFSRFPRISNTFAIDQQQIKIANPFGGGLYFEIPDGSSLGKVKVTVAGAVKMPMYSTLDLEGHSSDLAEFTSDLSLHQVPWFEITSDKFTTTQRINVRNEATNPQGLLDVFGEMFDAISAMTGRPSERIRSEWLATDAQITVRGTGMAASYPIFGNVWSNDSPEITNTDYFWFSPWQYLNKDFFEANANVDRRGQLNSAYILWHEWGHLHNQPTLSCQEQESNVHMLAAVAYNKVLGADLDTALKYSGFQQYTLDDSALDTMLSPNWQKGRRLCLDEWDNEVRYQTRSWARLVDLAKMFGWDSVGSIHKAFYDQGVLEGKAVNYGLEDDYFVITASNALSLNLVPVFEFWGIPVTAETKNTLSNLPIPAEFKSRLVNYKSLVPKTMAEFYVIHKRLSGTSARTAESFGRWDDLEKNFGLETAGLMTARIDNILCDYYGESGSCLPGNGDVDGDGILNSQDIYVFDNSNGDLGVKNFNWNDSDGDGVPDNSDPFPEDSSKSLDTDADGIADASDDDDDGDGLLDSSDAFPLDSTNGVFSYHLLYGHYEIKACTNACPTDLSIPSLINGRNVNRIGNEAFKGQALTNVVLPETLSEIGSKAFDDNLLTSIDIPNGLKRIGERAFADNQLITAKIPDGLEGIGNEAFESNLLVSITLPDSLSQLGWNVFAYNRLESVKLPAGISNIPRGLFQSNQLSNVTIPSSVVYIEQQSFNENQLTSIIIPANVAFIGNYAFKNNPLTAMRFLGDRPTFGTKPVQLYGEKIITYCSKTLGWPGEPIGFYEGFSGVIPIADNTTDSDNDGVSDCSDDFPLDSGESLDTDSDGLGNNADTDDDNDGVLDANDDLPLDSSETIDTDGDGVGNNADVYPENSLYSKDSDNDGMPDAWETKYGLDPNDPSDASSDQDNDGVSALDEFLAGTIPSGSLDIDGNEKYDALTDGLLLLRGMFGLDGSALITGTVASDATYTGPVDIESRIATLGDLADIDGNGQIDALTDGLLTLRYLFGLQGDTLINGVVADDATRKTAEEIEAHLETLMPAL
jgi:hypothetical protein